MRIAEFKPTIPASERPQTYAATGTGHCHCTFHKSNTITKDALFAQTLAPYVISRFYIKQA